MNTVFVLMMIAQNCANGQCDQQYIDMVPPVQQVQRAPMRQSSPAAAHHRAIVGVQTEDGAGAGVVFEQQGDTFFVITCQHIIENAQQCVITIGANRQVLGKVLATDKTYDLALIASRTDQPLTVLPLSTTFPQVGETVELCGYGILRATVNPPLQHWYGKVLGYEDMYGTGRAESLSVQATARSGDSGGAVVYNGRLAGVIHGGSPNMSGGESWPAQATYSGRIAYFVQKYIPAKTDVAQVSREVIAVQPVEDSDIFKEDITSLTRRVEKLEKAQAPAPVDLKPIEKRLDYLEAKDDNIIKSIEQRNYEPDLDKIREGLNDLELKVGIIEKTPQPPAQVPIIVKEEKESVSSPPPPLPEKEDYWTKTLPDRVAGYLAVAGALIAWIMRKRK